MDCCICSPMASVFRPPRNTICNGCYEAARCMIAFFSNLETEKGDDQSKISQLLIPNSSKGIPYAWNCMKEMKEIEQEMKEKMDFMDGFVVAFTDEMHTDIEVKPGSGPSIPAHRALLATKSVIFKTMLECDECKAPPTDTISLPELTHEELKCFLEFLYSGSLAKEKIEKHVYALLIASDKYDIPFLKMFCEKKILGSLDSSNALEVLEVSQFCSNKSLKDRAMKSIVKHMDDIVFSSRYEAFALKNAHLCVEITRALLRETKERCGSPQYVSLI